MADNFKDKYGEWALITGASSGIGEALAKRLAQKGLNIALVARGADRLKATEKAVASQYGVQTKIIAADVSKPEGIEEVIKATEGMEIGFLIPGAGVERHGEFVDLPIEDPLSEIDLNVRAPMVLAHHFGAQMKARKRGGILFVASVVAHMPNPYLANYAGTKAYIVSLSNSLRFELGEFGVDVSVLSPGPTDTPMVAGMSEEMDLSQFPMSLASPEEVADEVIKFYPKKPIIIPTRKNRMMVSVGSRFMPVDATIKQSGKTMQKVMKTGAHFGGIGVACRGADELGEF